MTTGIYEIKNTQNGKHYIGSAVVFSRRFNAHRRALIKGVHCNPKLQNAWNKYGSDVFLFTPLLVCERSELLLFEQKFIDKTKPIYNCHMIAGSPLGTKCSETTKAKLSKAFKGRISPMKGRKQSEEAKKKMSAIRKGRPSHRKGKSGVYSKETLEKMRESHLGSYNHYFGKKHTPEIRKKISLALVDKNFGSDNHMYGKSHTAETRGKISESLKRRYALITP